MQPGLPVELERQVPREQARPVQPDLMAQQAQRGLMERQVQGLPARPAPKAIQGATARLVRQAQGLLARPVLKAIQVPRERERPAPPGLLELMERQVPPVLPV